jgi:hypothetical protein
MTTIRHKIGVVIDYSIRIPNFIQAYSIVKQEIFNGIDDDIPLAIKQANEKNIQDSKEDFEDERYFFGSLAQTDPKAIKFYENTPSPISNLKDIDMTWKKYFYNEKHLQLFLQSYSFNLFGQGTVPNRGDIVVINTAQRDLADIILIDRVSNSRKVSNTFAFLAKSGIFCKRIEFLPANSDLSDLKAECIDIWDPLINKDHRIEQGIKQSAKFLEFMLTVENKIYELDESEEPC